MNKFRAFRERIAHIKIRTKLFLLILVTGAVCLSFFRYLWYKKWDAYYFLAQNLPAVSRPFPMVDEDFWTRIVEEAQKYEVPDSEDDKERVEALEPFFEIADEYTSISIYGLEDGLYRASCYPEVMLWNDPFNTFYQMAYRWIDVEINQFMERAVEFKNGYASVIVYFYHSAYFIVPYAVFCMLLCIFLFLFAILFFVGKKIKSIVRLEHAILQMSSGDLATPVANSGFDEIGILGLELDKLRSTLQENFLQEQKVHQSNQELIAALSHDLRTPLTILKGYLEILRLNRNPDLQAEYISRCMAKADDLKELTDRMFEYALVFDEEADAAEAFSLINMPAKDFFGRLQEHADFLRLAGFSVELSLPKEEEEAALASVVADETMVKRVLNNLFSNIIKYANKRETVLISWDMGDTFVLSVRNGIKKECDDVESTQIGLKSVEKMMGKMNGELTVQAKNGVFAVKLRFLAGE